MCWRVKVRINLGESIVMRWWREEGGRKIVILDGELLEEVK